MQRVVFIIRRYNPGQAWTNRLLAYAKGFAEMGANVVFYFIIPDKNRTPYKINITGVRVINLWESDGWLCRQHRAFSYLRNKRRICNIVEDGDLCFMSDGSGIYVNEILSSNKNVRIVFEVTEHPSVLKPNKKDLDKYLNALRKVDTLFVISNSLMNYFQEMGFSANMLHVINMFVDTDRFRNLKKQSKEHSIAYCGAVSLAKDGVDVLIKAFAHFIKKHPDYTLYIYGAFVNDDTKLKLEQLRDYCHVNQSVVFTGPIAYSEMPQRLVNASILALSRPNNLQNANGFPTKLGEYLATGNPVVVTSVGEIPVFIQDGINGYVSKPDDYMSFAEKLDEAANALVNGINVGVKGKELAFHEFNSRMQTALAFEILNSMN